MTNLNALKLIVLTLLFACGFEMTAEVNVADIFSDHMVLQRNIQLKIWGTADPQEELALSFNGQNVKTKADDKGKWIVVLKPMSAGGPFVMTVEGKNKVIFSDILIGDVWLCSGQSNMQFKMKQLNNPDNEIEKANYPNIRLFSVPHNISNVPLTEIPNRYWEICTPGTIKDFSAVGYFFGRNLHLEKDIPIGLINSSYGGTCVESWTSKESITKLPNYEDFGKKIEAFDIEEERNKKRNKLSETLGELPEKETGVESKWMNVDTDRSNWLNIQLPSIWEERGYEDLDGIVWFSQDFDLDIKDSTNTIELHLGVIDDSDIVWVNGVKIGETNWGFTEQRVYKVPMEAVKSGMNNITIRVQDRRNKGGFLSSPKDFVLKLGKTEVSLSGKWKFKVDRIYDNFDISPNELPSLLYNAMINPLIPYGIKGVIWYQGENNTPRAKEYAVTFPNMIENWRENWEQGDFPFLFVQLANFGAPNPRPSNSNWAELRESQTKTLKLKNTGMALAIDIGEAYDIHPKNKQDVGKRLMLAAQKVAYNENIVHSGPQFKSMKIKKDKAIISFDYIGSGLDVKGNSSQIKEFEIAGVDQRFYTACAKAEGNKVIVWSDKVDNPVAVRFAWSNNPADFNLYNKEGLPAIPFRSDDWKGVTDGLSFDN